MTEELILVSVKLGASFWIVRGNDTELGADLQIGVKLVSLVR